jgi:prolyl oligopeptidase
VQKFLRIRKPRIKAQSSWQFNAPFLIASGVQQHVFTHNQGHSMPSVLEPPPFTPIEPVTEVLHGVEITDPYRWLEDQDSISTRRWINGQTDYTRTYFDSLPGREVVRERVSELLSIPSVTEPWNVGGRYFFLKRYQDREQPVIVVSNDLFGEETIIVDSALHAPGFSTAVAIAAISRDARFLAYSVRQGGTDHSALEILDVERNTVLPDRLPEGFCAGIAFAADGSGFYYSHRALNDPRPNYRAAFWHRFGTKNSEDQEVFFAGEEPNLFLGLLESSEAGLLAYLVFSTGKRPRTSVYLGSMQSESVPKLLLHDVEACFVPFFVRGQLLAYTDLAAPNFRIVRVDITDPDPAHWQDIVPASDRCRIQQFAVAGDQVFVTRIHRFSSRIEVFGLDGRQREDIPLPPYGTVNLVNLTTTTDKMFYSHTSIFQPPSIYCYDTRAQNVVIWDQPNVAFDPSVIAVEEAVYTSKDGTAVPLLLAARTDLLRSGPLPTFLTGYGGFGNCVTPRFSAFASFLMEQGFLFAVPALRGGSELGEEWHLAGRRENRQNSFDDFIAAAEWLMSQGRSERGRTAIGGGSNAGLLVGAAITQRPDLFRAAICLGPLLDMARYHLFDFAAGWADEYGSPDDEGDFQSLLAYSPYHRVQDGMAYPAVLLISGDADNRCNPMHARKMTARLQAANASSHPILLDYRPPWGHTPVQPLSTKIEALTNRLAFICHEVEVQVEARRPS